MENLKKAFPMSFKEKNDVGALVINILIHLVIGVIATTLLGFLAGIPIVGIVFTLLSTLIDLYLTAGIILSILNYCKVI